MANQAQSVERLFGAALELPPEQRSAFLDQACREAPELRRMVEQLLLEDERLGSFLDKPVFTPGGAPLASAATVGSLPHFQPAEVIANRFEVVRFIARGGMGEVYEVKDQFLQELNVALKIIRPEIASDAGSSRRFEQEVILARKVTHPNLCPIYDIFRCEQPPPAFSFLTMKLLRGETLDARLKLSGSISPDEALAICRQLILGVTALHEGGIIHRDLKPNNVMLEHAAEDARARGVRVSIMDFGLARLNQIEATVGQSITIAGTAGYMAPELLRGLPPSKASDLYALGIVLHQVLTGQRPADSASGLSLIPLPALRASQAPAPLLTAIEGFLSSDPAKRVLAFEHLQTAETGAVSATHSAPAHMLRSRTTGYAAVAIIVLALIGLTVWLSAPAVPRPLISQQVTFSREAKERPLVSVGSRLYFQSQREPAEMAMTGGPIAPLRNLGSGFVIKDVSPDGSEVLAVKPESESLEAGSGTAWIASTLGGAPRRLGSYSAQDMRWAPDGQSILLADKGAIYSMKEDGRNQRKLWERSGIVDSLGFSPDGREITWALIDPKGNSRQWRMKADGTEPRLILPDWPSTSDQWFGQWTRDGKHYVFLSDRLAGVNSFAGQGNVYELIEPRWFEFWKKPSAAILTTNQLDIQALAPGADGDSIFVLGQADQGAMQVLDSATGKYVPFLDGLAAAGFVISPDRQWMAYSDFPAGNLWKSRLDGSEAVQLTTVQAFMQDWSPDGKSLACSDGHHLYRISKDGGPLEQIIPGGDNELMPSWLPDGKSIAFTYWDGVTHPRKGIPIVDLATRKVSTMPGSDQSYGPFWSPDGKYMVAAADNPSRLVLYSTKTKVWTDLRTFDTPIGSWTWTSDSRALYFRMLEGLTGIYRLTVPDGIWTKISGLEGLNLRTIDSAPSLTIDGRPALMSHTGVTQIYSLHWTR
jgi:serine/threonine protein kinase